MSEQGDQELPDDELDKARERLQKLYQKVRSYGKGSHPGGSEVESSSLSSPATAAEDVPLEEIRDKLSAINSYFKDRLAGRRARPPVFESPAPEPPVPEPVEPEPPQRAKIALPPQDKVKKVKPPPAREAPQPQKVEAPSAKVIPTILTPAKNAKGERIKLGVGLDLGTSSIIASRENDENRVVSRIERNVFLGVRSDETTKGLLAKLNIKYAATAQKLYVLGDMALELSHIFNREGQRPMSIGILNPGEMESLPIIKLLVQNVLWPPRTENEVCCFSVPAKIMESDADTIYHRGVFERILTEVGFKAIVVDEGYAVVLAELADKDFTGIGISCGAGLVNVCASFKSMPVLSFAVGRGGDWIDKNAATALGIVSSNVMAIKEQGISLVKPVTREEEAIAIYYRSYVRYFLESIARQFSVRGTAPQFTKPVDIVLAGGSSLPGGFLDVVKDELKRIDLGVPVGSISRAEEPLLSVSRGCLFQAMNTAMGGEAEA